MKHSPAKAIQTNQLHSLAIIVLLFVQRYRAGVVIISEAC